MLGFRLSQKSVLWPLVIVIATAWLLVTWCILRPKADDSARSIVRQWMDRNIRAYDYAARIGGDPQASRVKREALTQLRDIWHSIVQTGLENDALWLDRSIICLRVAQDFEGDEAAPWYDGAEAALGQVSEGSRSSDYFIQARKALNGERLTEPERERLQDSLRSNPGSWSWHFMAWMLGVERSRASSATEPFNRMAYTLVWVSGLFWNCMLGVAVLTVLPGYLCLRKPMQRRKRSDRLQKLLPLSLTLFFVLSGLLVNSGALHLVSVWLLHSEEWRNFAHSSGPNAAAAMWQALCFTVLLGLPFMVKAGLGSGWGSLKEVMGIEWLDFIRIRQWTIGIAFGSCLLVLSSLICDSSGYPGWGSDILDATSRWPFSHIPTVTVAALVLIIVVGPVVEELLFRGFLFAAFRNRFGSTASVWLTATIFAAGHAYSMKGSIAVLIGGLALGWIRSRSNRISTSIMAHICLNALAVLQMSFWSW